MSNPEQQILFICRHSSFGMVKVDQGCIVTSEGNVYDFELVQGNYHRYFPPKKNELLQKFQEIIQKAEPSKKCDKDEILKAYELAKQVDTKSEIFLTRTGVCDYGSMTLSAFINDNFITLLQDGDIAGAVDFDQINQIKDIAVKNGIFTFKFLRNLDMEKIKNDQSVIKYPCQQRLD